LFRPFINTSTDSILTMLDTMSSMEEDLFNTTNSKNTTMQPVKVRRVKLQSGVPLNEVVFVEKSLQQLEKEYSASFFSYEELVFKRISLAQIASTMDLPDNSIFILMKAYSDVQSFFNKLLTDLNGREPTGFLTELLARIKLLKIMVLTQIQSTLVAHGGPKLSPQELDAMLSPGPVQNQDSRNSTEQKRVDDFNLFQGPKAQEKLTQSASKAIEKQIPELLQEVVRLLASLKENPDGGIGFARFTVDRALTRLEMIKGLLRLASATSNGMNTQSMNSGNSSPFDTQVQSLEALAKQLYRSFEERGFSNARQFSFSNHGLTPLDIELRQKRLAQKESSLDSTSQQVSFANFAMKVAPANLN
jgi:hypothetical protein